MKLDQNKTVLVYDLGGGTFDVTVIRVSDKTITVLATDGNHQLGGFDWDKTLAEYVLSKFNQEHKTSYTLDSNDILRNTLMIEAENKKKQLSQRNSVNFILDFEGKSLKVEITREQFEQLTEVLLDETIDKTHEVIAQAKLKGLSNVDEILLVGGSSRMPQIKSRVDGEFNCDSKLTDPDECVAKGAAIFALNESFSAAMDEYNDGDRDDKPKNIGQKSQVRVVNVTSKNYGMATYVNETEEMIAQIIFSNTSLNNCRGESTFFTMDEKQSSVNLSIFESDISDELIPLEAGVLLERENFFLNKEVEKGTPINVVFQVDTEGILHVHARLENESIEFDVKLKGVMNSEQLKNAKFLAAKTTVE
jgi:molecular chaperone DnaK